MKTRFRNTLCLIAFLILFIGLIAFSQRALAENGDHLYTVQAIQTTALRDTTFPGNEVYHRADRMPKLKGTLKELYQRVIYPKECRKAGIEGIVYVQFVVNKQGRPTHVHAIRGIGESCDQAAVEAVKNYARFIPGFRNGESVRVQIALPIAFKLQVNQNRIYTSADKEPKLKMPFIKLESKVTYPEKCRKAGIQGKVKLEFIVNKKGMPQNVHVLKGIGSACDSAAVAAVEKYAKFSPGLINGVAVKVSTTLPIFFNDYYFPPKASAGHPKVPKLKMDMAELQSMVDYPKRCRQAGIEGTVIVEFIINKQGVPTNVHLVKGIRMNCGQAAVKTVKRYARFTPGMQNGKPVKVRMTIPFTIRLRNY